MEARYLQIARDANKMQEIIPDHVPFPCNVTGKMRKRSLGFIGTIFFLTIKILLLPFLESYFN